MQTANKGNDKSVVVTEKEFPTELADKKDTCTTPVQVPGTPGTPDTPGTLGTPGTPGTVSYTHLTLPTILLV